ncbi:MAG: ferritin-like domain-containing protein [Acidimicrobiia bacterium]|nr:ferritin-like domain-containing protein [Acidimicrobiia bacterium]
MNMDYNRDEFRRAVRSADEANRAAMPRFTEVLERYFSADSEDSGMLGTADKAAFLGVPSRRAFLRTSGLTVVGAAAFVACGSDEAPPGAAETGTVPATEGTTATTAGETTTTTEAAAGPTADDVGLATAAIQIENTAVAAYTAVATLRGAELSPEIVEAATTFADHHAQHAQALNAVLTSNGADTIPEDQLFSAITLPDEAALLAADVPTIGGIARGLEHQAAATYVSAVPLLSLPVLRQALMGIGGAEARHVTAWDILLGGGVGGYDAELVAGGNYPTDESFLN